VSALWGHKALDNLVDLDLSFEVERDQTALKRLKG
jgi:DNA mismatch repair protein PMS2